LQWLLIYIKLQPTQRIKGVNVVSKENLPLGELTDDTSPSFSLLNQLFKQTVNQYSSDCDAQIAAAKALRQRFQSTPPAKPTTTDYTAYLSPATKK
jgi:hypothetical protein